MEEKITYGITKFVDPVETAIKPSLVLDILLGVVGLGMLFGLCALFAILIVTSLYFFGVFAPINT